MGGLFMKLLLMVGTVFLVGVVFITGCSSKNSERTYDGLAFKTTLKEAPQQFKDTDTYFLNFDTIDVLNDKDNALKNTFNQGGILVLAANKLPQDAKIGKGTNIVVHLKENFATTDSMPPQVLEDSVVKVEFNLQ